MTTFHEISWSQLLTLQEFDHWLLFLAMALGASAPID
jgi:hypothetical protein